MGPSCGITAHIIPVSSINTSNNTLITHIHHQQILSFSDKRPSFLAAPHKQERQINVQIDVHFPRLWTIGTMRESPVPCVGLAIHQSQHTTINFVAWHKVVLSPRFSDTILIASWQGGHRHPSRYSILLHYSSFAEGNISLTTLLQTFQP